MLGSGSDLAAKLRLAVVGGRASRIVKPLRGTGGEGASQPARAASGIGMQNRDTKRFLMDAPAIRQTAIERYPAPSFSSAVLRNADVPAGAVTSA